jgi:hypothetical protein
MLKYLLSRTKAKTCHPGGACAGLDPVAGIHKSTTYVENTWIPAKKMPE